ncbi:FAD-dependent oxidoreductase [Lentilactobacillus kefiri]|uniref:NADH peroxidase n=2 Tax=Lentilactobacillus kefiri TaxID=33962 RepID=A0A8E1V0J5_LENKE|nr:FAD-dependent oxidoreductase [Lentilactobacillus kefiri]KRL69271.1 NADH peroxidase [Lentilactobacillus parakefiri DSM 10551]KRM51456.1 NADH peroxidase [Lentilactobacillus kefiri DSM 20587 = JCM 5818]MCJ2162133.1 FAD-dependent oxidoreductase [Lentilactobacillus kefiri]MCP9369299.1 FAD-dependent oxidoreductase [Lentilactobacillus kefiri]MDH5108761.1 FAD-dependent oxidoreductase [Lentilactobacillus kefiri]
MKVIVVGSSHGGFEAVRGILAEKPDTEIQWYEKGDFVSFLSCGMQLYLEGVVKNVNSVRYATAKGMRAKGVNVFVHQEVTSIDPKAHTVTVHNLDDDSTREEKYDKLILSAGAVPANIPVPGNDLANIYAMRGRDWAIKLKAKTVDPDVQNVAVIGAGYIGIEAAEVFSKAGKHVTLIDILPRPLQLYLDQEFTDILSDTMKDHNIYLATGQGVKEFEGKDGKVSVVKTDQAEYPADLVIETAGIRANTGWLKDTLDLTEKGLVKVNDHLETSQPDIYAVGDSTKVPFAPTGKELQIALATNARRQGRIAAKNVLGHDMKMPAVSGSSALSVYDYHFASTGIKEGTSDANGVKSQSVFVTDTTQPPFVPDEAGNEKVYFKLTFDPDTHRILGAQIMSKRDVTANINAVSLAIQGKMTLEDLAYADFFFQPGFDRPWNIMNVAAQKALQDLDQ